MPAGAVRVDVHQHIWSEPLLDALASRRELPFVRSADGLTVLHAAGERPYLIDVDAETPSRREALLRADRLDLALIAISSPIGIEVLPRAAANELIDAHLEGVGALGPGFTGWGPIALDEADPDDVDRVLRRGSVGVSLPAAALAGADAIAAISPVLERVAQRNVPLFIHPGAAVGAAPRHASLSEPLWWRALTDYVAQMQAAWLTFVTAGRREHPALVVVFAMLAGCVAAAQRAAPGERWTGRRTSRSRSVLRHLGLRAVGGGCDSTPGWHNAAPVRVRPSGRGAGPVRTRGDPANEHGPVPAPAWSGRMSLTPPELERFVAALAGSPDLWRDHVRHADDARVYELIWDDDDVNAWVICWSDEQDTGFHDHDVSGAAITVISGHVREERLRLDGAPHTRTLGPGETFTVPAVAIHRVVHSGAGSAVTIHAYSPPLTRTGAYRRGPDGELQRTLLSIEEELRSEAALS